MQFDRLNIRILKKLKKSGFTILSSNNKVYDETVYWFPEKVDDLDNYLTELETSGELKSDPFILVIDDALENIKEEHLFGYVFC